MNMLFTFKTILQLAFLFNHNKLNFDTRLTDDEWTAFHQGSLLNKVVLYNASLGQFVFKRVRDTREYSLTDMKVGSCDANTWHKLIVFISVIDNPMSLNTFKK